MNPNAEFDSLTQSKSFDRRSFLVTSLGAGFALAVQPVMAQTAIDDQRKRARNLSRCQKCRTIRGEN